MDVKGIIGEENPTLFTEMENDVPLPVEQSVVFLLSLPQFPILVLKILAGLIKAQELCPQGVKFERATGLLKRGTCFVDQSDRRRLSAAKDTEHEEKRRKAPTGGTKPNPAILKGQGEGAKPETQEPCRRDQRRKRPGRAQEGPGPANRSLRVLSIGRSLGHQVSDVRRDRLVRITVLLL